MPSTSSISPSAEEKLTCTSSISNSTKKFKPGREVGTQFQIWRLKLSSLPLISAETQSRRASGVEVKPAALQRCLQFVHVYKNPRVKASFNVPSLWGDAAQAGVFTFTTHQ